MTLSLRTTYATGEGTLVIGSRAFVLLDAQPDHPAVEAVLAPTVEGATFEDLTSLLLAIGFSNLPGLACGAFVDHDLQFLIRGEVTAEVRGADGVSHEREARWATTWSEARIPGALAVVLRLGNNDATPRMPLQTGSAQASIVAIERVDTTADHRGDDQWGDDRDPRPGIAGVGTFNAEPQEHNAEPQDDSSGPRTGNAGPQPDDAGEGGGQEGEHAEAVDDLQVATEHRRGASLLLPNDSPLPNDAPPSADPLPSNDALPSTEHAPQRFGELLPTSNGDAPIRPASDNTEVTRIYREDPIADTPRSPRDANTTTGTPEDDRSPSEVPAGLISSVPGMSGPLAAPPIVPNEAATFRSDGPDAQHAAPTDRAGTASTSARAASPAEMSPAAAIAPPIVAAPLAPPPPTSSQTPLSSAPETSSPSDGRPDPADTPGDDGGIDGVTVRRGASEAASPPPQPPSPEPDTPSVQAIRCAADHPNPPHFEKCRQCGEAIEDRTVRIVPRPALGRIVFPSGRHVVLDRPVVMGRKPPAGSEVEGEPAQVLALKDPDKMLSRVHLEIRLVDWQVQVMDRDSMNHTYIEVPGKPQMQLRPGEPHPIPPGTIVNLADALQFTFDISQP